jgi:two-component system, OmpR family, phosphate regulon response regulator PhoB
MQPDIDKPLVLIVEDELPLSTLLAYNLEKEGFRVATAADGEQAITLSSEALPDLVILDWMLPVLSGLDVCRHLRRRSRSRDVPILMLTARGDEGDKVRGLNTGADDFMTKPFSLPELIARVRALLRRTHSAPNKGNLSCGDVTIDMTAHRVTRNGRTIHLGPTEYRLLQYLMQHPDHVFSREQLLDAVWGRDIYVEPRTVDVHVRRLRKALNQGDAPDLIRTVRAAGYGLDVPNGVEEASPPTS